MFLESSKVEEINKIRLKHFSALNKVDKSNYKIDKSKSSKGSNDADPVRIAEMQASNQSNQPIVNNVDKNSKPASYQTTSVERMQELLQKQRVTIF